MHVKITFKNLINCCPKKDFFKPTISIKMQNNEVLVPKNSFKGVLSDGQSVILEVRNFAHRGFYWEFITKHSISRSTNIKIDTKIISAVHRI
jgi:hypothetical protein